MFKKVIIIVEILTHVLGSYFQDWKDWLDRWNIRAQLRWSRTPWNKNLKNKTNWRDRRYVLYPLYWQFRMPVSKHYVLPFHMKSLVLKIISRRSEFKFSICRGRIARADKRTPMNIFFCVHRISDLQVLLLPLHGREIFSWPGSMF